MTAASTSTSCSRRSGCSARALRTSPHSGARDSPEAPSSGPVATAPLVSHVTFVSFNRASPRIPCSSTRPRAAAACAAATRLPSGSATWSNTICDGTPRAIVKPRHQSRHAVGVIKTKTRRQRSVASHHQRQRFRPGLAQPHRTPLQAVQMLRLAARGLADLRFARFPQKQAPNMRHRTPVTIRKLQLRQRFALAAALHRGADPQLTRSRRCQRHLRPLERQQQRTLAAARAGNPIKAQNMQRTIQQRRMQPILIRRRPQRLRQHRTAVHRITNTPGLDQAPGTTAHSRSRAPPARHNAPSGQSARRQQAAKSQAPVPPPPLRLPAPQLPTPARPAHAASTTRPQAASSARL